MNRFFVTGLLTILVIGCKNSPRNPKITYKSYSYEFKADDYPKSITDFYKENEKLNGFTDRELAIKMNIDIILENLIDNILRFEFRENTADLNEDKFNQIKNKLKNYKGIKSINSKYEKIQDTLNNNFSEKLLINRTQQWIADSIVQSKYFGNIYYDDLKRVLKPKEAYKKMVLELIDKNEIVITDEFMKGEIINKLNRYTKGLEKVDVNFYLIETWE